MGIFDALTTAVAGLQAQSFALQNISGNIANSQTTGYKETDTAFQDLVNQAGINLQTPDGVTARSVATNTVQGSITSTSVSTDMAVNGDGFFVVAKPTGFVDNQPTFSGINDYTRAGDFTMNASGNLVNSAGYYLQGIPVDPTTGNPLGSVPQVLQFNNNFIPAVATTSVTYQANLPATPKSGVISPNSFEANPLAGAPVAAQIVGSGASLKPDAPALGTGTVSGLAAGTTLASLGIGTGDSISIYDGTNTTSYVVPGAATVGNLITAINGGTAAVTASLSGGNLVLTGNNDVAGITVTATGSDATDLGFGAGNNSFKPVNLLTQSAVAQGQTLTVVVGGGATQTITFGTGGGSQVATLGQLQTAVAGLTGVTGTVDTATGDVSLAAISPTASIAVGGTASAAKFGILNLTALPANGTVIANDVSTFDSQSVDGGSITAFDSVGNPVNVQFRWAQVSSSSSRQFVAIVLSEQFGGQRDQFGLDECRDHVRVQFERRNVSANHQSHDSGPDGERRQSWQCSASGRHGRPDAVRQCQRRRPGQQSAAKRLCRGLPAIGRRRYPEPRCRQFHEWPDHSARRGHARIVQRRRLVAGPQRRRLCRDAGIGSAELFGDR